MIDWSHVDELQEDMAEGFDEIVEVFLEEVEESLAKLDPSAGANSLAANLHFLKGAALNLGFADFAALCGDGEDRANAKQDAFIDIAAVHSCYIASRDAFLTELQRRAA
jgi:HPt (histidine-containing phosphotransfer) domain-containing protein